VIILIGFLGYGLILNDKISDLRLKVSELEDEISSCENLLDQLKTNRPIVVLRVDDIQDTLFRGVQLYLMEFCLDEDVPMTLGVIPDLFGEDDGLVELVTQAIKEGSEISAHGWSHRDFTELDLEEQEERLKKSKRKIMEVLDVNVSIFTPPYYTFNLDTLKAMENTGYRILSSHVELSQPGISSEKITSIPATVELSTLEGGEWKQKSPEKLALEIMKSVKSHGFAVIITHPQEYLTRDSFEEGKLDSFKEMILTLKETYTFHTIKYLYEEQFLQNHTREDPIEIGSSLVDLSLLDNGPISSGS
jgi:peptidoglycan/xylan/chitin deacetylase (PgdA/CDA1 family)